MEARHPFWLLYDTEDDFYVVQLQKKQRHRLRRAALRITPRENSDFENLPTVSRVYSIPALASLPLIKGDEAFDPIRKDALLSSSKLPCTGDFASNLILWQIKEMGGRYLFICLYVWLEKYFSKGDYQNKSSEVAEG